MAQADRIYKKAFQDHFTNHVGNFPLSQNIRLGDYGVLQHGYFVKVGNLADAPFKIKVNELKDDSPTQEEFQSSSRVSVTAIAKGDTTPTGVAAKASLNIGFSGENAIYFSSANVLYNELKNLPAVGSAILELYKNDKWEKRHIIVTKVIEAKKAIMVISGSNDCSVTIEAEGDVPKIDIGNLKVKLGFSRSEKVSYKIITNETCQLGFGLSRVYNPLFNQPIFKAKDNRVHLFAGLDESRHVDAENLAFGDIIPDMDEVN